jgi:hypothetical protein
MADGLYMSARPMLAASGGRLIALSTPHGTRGWFFEAWRGSEAWARFEVPATLCPRIGAAFLEEEWRNMGEWWFKQEYCCEFLDAEAQPFSKGDIERALEAGIEAWEL